MQFAEPGTKRLHFFAHTIKLVLQRIGIEEALWKATGRQLRSQREGDPASQFDINGEVDVGEFNMDVSDFHNPVELVLLCRFESHSRMPYFKRSQRSPGEYLGDAESGSLPWDIAKFLDDAVDAGKPRARASSGRAYQYAVLAVETVNGISCRLGVGTVDLKTFHEAEPERRLVVLG